MISNKKVVSETSKLKKISIISLMCTTIFYGANIIDSQEILVSDKFYISTGSNKSYNESKMFVIKKEKKKKNTFTVAPRTGRVFRSVHITIQEPALTTL